ncbi:amidohydrolase family protein [Gemmatimonas groenlandica]|uniref:Amidohydrolase family protein n=1 Tax=Gemmatimonas groenlandica TaxID=2732249 RepID=A0A6M4IZE1_9BACT|nr:amidohydrolase family protein [Gemmatimonas groenlandica]QJR37591.1 amidohydrolase family protein [Gemmatimonas groenlandica]
MMRGVRAVWVGVALLTGCAREVPVPAPQPIIDMHLHAFAYDAYGLPAPPNEVTGNVPHFGSDTSAMRATFDTLRLYHVVRAVASGPLADVRRWRAANPTVIMGGAYTGPRDTLLAVTTLEQLFADGELKVLGELGLQYRGLSPSAPELTPYWALAAARKIPVAVHTGLGDAGTPFDCCPNFRARLGNPLLLEDVLVAHPGLRVNVMHAGYPFLAETKALLTIYPEVYVDIGVLSWAIPRAEFYAYLKALIDAGFANRVMFGSDQMVWPEAIGMAIAGITEAPFLTPAQRQAIFYDNAARFLRLTPAEIARDHAAVR